MVRDNKGDRPFNLAQDLDLLRQKIVQVGNVNLVQIDPITAYLGSKSSNGFFDDADIDRHTSITPATVAQERGCRSGRDQLGPRRPFRIVRSDARSTMQFVRTSSHTASTWTAVWCAVIGYQFQCEGIGAAASPHRSHVPPLVTVSSKADKLMFSGNHRPGLRTVDEAIRRRMNLIEC